MMQYWVQVSEEEELQRMKMRCSNRSAGDAHSAANEWTNQRVHPEAPTCSLATGRVPTGIRLTCFNTCTIAIATLSPHHSTLPSKHKFPGSVSCLLTFICLVFIFLLFFYFCFPCRSSRNSCSLLFLPVSLSSPHLLPLSISLSVIKYLTSDLSIVLSEPSLLTST